MNRSFLSSILDIFYPPTCIHCQAPDAWVCSSCLLKLFLYHHIRQDVPPFSSVTICGPYADPRWRQLLTSYKYHSARCLEIVIEQVLKRFRDELRDLWPWAGYQTMTIVPLPTDKKHIRQRGFDHALHIAQSTQKILIPWAEVHSILKRKKSVLAHANLPTDLTRQANIQGVFEAIQPISGPVLLIDDVFTTGATAKEAARVLLNAGASEVHLFTLTSGK